LRKVEQELWKLEKKEKERAEKRVSMEIGKEKAMRAESTEPIQE